MKEKEEEKEKGREEGGRRERYIRGMLLCFISLPERGLLALT